MFCVGLLVRTPAYPTTTDETYERHLDLKTGYEKKCRVDLRSIKALCRACYVQMRPFLSCAAILFLFLLCLGSLTATFL